LTQKIQSVLVIGLGKVGKLVATLLFDNGYQTTGLDSGSHRGHPFKTIKGRVQSKSVLKKAIKDHDAVVTCLPYDLNLEVARETHSAGKHYFDLTEDVPTTEAIKKLSKTAKGVMAPQCGLAPGFICIVGADLAGKFRRQRSIELRVGALPQHPRGLLGYAFNWSPEGVVNEYLNDCEVIKESKRAKVTAMEGLETIVIDGVPLEAFATSGGLGTMCETYDGAVENLNYKTIRYPGHCQLMKFFFNELFMRKDRKRAGEILVNAKPPVNDDVVFVHAAVEGQQNGKIMREEFVRSYYPLEIAGQDWRAIAWTTAASVCAVVDLVSRGVLPQKGFIKQEDIPLDQFFNTPTGHYFLT
jgi:saccharopine dehydrogenase-like NADP-dependent oxidoreductase